MVSTAPASRPSLARKHTRKSDEAAQAELNAGIRITIEGEPYEVRVGDLNPGLVRELRRAYGGSFHKLMDEISGDPDIDLISTFVWLARRVAGETVEHDAVEVDYTALLADGFDIDIAGDHDEATTGITSDNPE